MEDAYNQFQHLLAENKLTEAQAFCDQWVLDNPETDLAHNCLGLTFAKQGKMNEAVAAFSKAIEINPNNIAYHDNLSNAYLALGNIEKAKQHLNEALRIDPHHAQSYNNLARLLYKQSLFNDAIFYLEKALRINPDYWEAHYNLAHSHAKLNHLNQASVHYNEVLRLMPNHPTAHHNLGLILFEEGLVDEAAIHLQKALELSPDNVEAARFLGYSELALGHIDEAIHAFERTLLLASHLPDVYHNLGVLHLRKSEKEKALEYFEKTLALDAENDTARHMIMALKGEQSSQAPKTYIADLFDQYADYYDRHVKEKLKYNVPALLRSAVSECLTGFQRAGRVLDIGCGTGLCGVYFRDLAFNLIGVDLSHKMAKKARQLGAYDDVVTSDFNDYLTQQNLEPFNLISAGDVLVYLGDLEQSFENIARKLITNGLFAFTVERLENSSQNYILKPTGRFAHSKKYIQYLAQKYNFTIEKEEDIIPREHDGKPVEGCLYVLRKL